MESDASEADTSDLIDRRGSSRGVVGLIVVLAFLSDLNRSRASYFPDVDKLYSKTELALYSGATSTACGTGQFAMGPFHRSPDSLVYIDLASFPLGTRTVLIEGPC